MKLERETRESIHASDLLSPLLSYWNKTKPLPLSEDEIGYFTTGNGHHAFLIEFVTGLKGATQEDSKVSSQYGLAYSPDLAQLRAEFKTSRIPTEPVDEKEMLKLFSSYAKQCLIYALCEGVTQWKLFVLYIGLRKKNGGIYAPRLRCYTIQWTEEELEAGHQWVQQTVATLKVALKKKEPTRLPLCEDWMCTRFSEVTRKKEPVCKYWEYCKPKGRYTIYNKLKGVQYDDTKER